MKKIVVALLSLIIILTTDPVSGQECGPSSNDIYDFPIGSVFQYRTTSGGSELYIEEVLLENYTVTDKWVEDEILLYTRQGVYEYTMLGMGLKRDTLQQHTGEIMDTIRVFNLSSHFLNSCEDQLVHIESNEDYYSYMKIDNLQKAIGGSDNLYKYDENNNLVKVGLSNSYEFKFEHVFEKGVGLMLKYYSNINFYSRTEIEGYIIGVKSFGMLTSVNDISLDDALKIYPNVVEGNQKINIESDYDYKSLSIVSLDGKVIQTEPLHQEYISLDNLPKGVYFLTFIFDKHRTTRKVFKL